MINKLKEFFTLLSEDTNSHQDNKISIEIACAVLLCEVMRADGVLDNQEQETLKSLLMMQFSLLDTEVENILEQAIHLSENASDFYQFTSTINKHYSLEQRKKIVSLLWEIAYADGELANIEEHIIRKIADLLHLRHDEYIATKLNAQESI
jgi:uncharacterized tellurite resistance protein B-like protein